MHDIGSTVRNLSVSPVSFVGKQVAIPAGQVAFTPEEAVAAFKKMPGSGENHK